MTGARPIVVTPGMQESAIEQLARMILGTQRLAADLRFTHIELDLADAAESAAGELAAHRARHGRTLPDTAPRV